MVHKEKQFTPANLVILTVSDTRTEENDTSGAYLKEAAEESGHRVLSLMRDIALSAHFSKGNPNLVEDTDG